MKNEKLPLIYFGILNNKRKEKEEIIKKREKIISNIIESFVRFFIAPALLVTLIGLCFCVPTNMLLSLFLNNFFLIAFTSYETIKTIYNKNNNSIFAIQNIYKAFCDIIKNISNLHTLNCEYIKKDKEISRISNGLRLTLEQRKQENIKEIVNNEPKDIIEQKIEFLCDESRKLPDGMREKYLSEIKDATIKYREYCLSQSMEDSRDEEEDIRDLIQNKNSEEQMILKR